MSNFLHIIFVIIVNIIFWGMFIAYVIGAIAILWAIITGKWPGKGDNGLPWL